MIIGVIIWGNNMLIGQEYILSAFFKESLKKGIDTIPLHLIFLYGNELQNIFNKNNIDVVVLNHSYSKAIFVYYDYFKEIKINGEYHIQILKNSCTDKLVISDLEIAIIMSECAKKILDGDKT